MIESIIIWVLSKISETAAGGLIKRGLAKAFPKLFKNETKEIIDLYENRIEKKNKEFEELRQERDRETARHQEEQDRVARSLRRRSISVDKLIERYHKPLSAIIISYATQKEETGTGRTRNSHFIREELERFNSKYLGGTDSLIPPRSVPPEVRNQSDLEGWFEREILKGRYCKIKFLILFDIRKDAFWRTYLPYAQINPMHRSIGEVLSVEDLFTEEQIRRIAISDVITGGDIAWLASAVVSGAELETVLRNQALVERKLNHPSLRVLASGTLTDDIAAAFDGILADPANVAREIVQEAQFWYEKIGRS